MDVRHRPRPAPAGADNRLTPRTFATLAAHIAAFETATEALDGWCRAYLRPDDGPVLARVLHDAPGLSDAASRALGAAPEEVLHHRRVELIWGDTVIEKAENWYLPGRLGAAMRAALADRVPFGRVIETLRPRRIVTLLEALDGAEGGGPCLRIRALVTTATRGPIALVREEYQPALLAQPYGP